MDTFHIGYSFKRAQFIATAWKARSHGGPSFTMTADSCTHSTATAEFIQFSIDGVMRLSQTPHGQQYLPTWDEFGVFVTGHETVCFKTIIKHTYTRQCFSPKWWNPGEVEFWNTRRHCNVQFFAYHSRTYRIASLHAGPVGCIACTLIVNMCDMSLVCHAPMHYVTWRIANVALLTYLQREFQWHHLALRHSNWILFPALMLHTGACANAALLTYSHQRQSQWRHLALCHRIKLNYMTLSRWLH